MCWLTDPITDLTCPGRLSTSIPATRALPSSGRDSVVRILTAVVLPAPFGPSSAKMLPSATQKLRPSSARTSDLYVLRRPSASTTGLLVIRSSPNDVLIVNNVLYTNNVYYRTAFSSTTLLDVSETAGDQTRSGRPGGGDRPPASAPEPPWRSAPRRGRPPRPQLSRDLVVTAALKVVESDGGDALTMRRVADEIGVSASSLYGYVANKEELVQLVLEQIMAEIPFPQPGPDWQEMLRSWARETLGVFRRHPGVAGLSLGRVPFGPAMLTGVERMLAAMRSAGIPDQVAAFAGDLGSLYVAAYAHEQRRDPARRAGRLRCSGRCLAQVTAAG